MTTLRTTIACTFLLAAVALLAACGSDDAASTPATTAAAATTSDACAKESLALLTSGQLTIGTDKPAYPPYFMDEKPENGKGFEGALAYAIADQLGFAPGEVTWVVVPFDSSYAPGDKSFDFDLNQISITAPRQKVVDFSSPYYTAPQAVIVSSKSPLAKATSLAELKDAQLGVQVGTTSLDAATSVLAPSQDVKVFNNSNDVVAAFKQGQVDAIVVDLPTAFYLTAAVLDNAMIVGQFNAPGGDQWGALLQKDSALTTCVSKAVDSLRDSGELAKITEQWMGTEAGAPELK